MGKSSTKPLSIVSLEEIAHLHSSPMRVWKLDGPIELQVPGLAQGARDDFESRINELAGVCGCAEGSAAGGVTLIAVALVWIQRDVTFSLQSILTASAAVIGAVLLGKLVRVIIARRQLRSMLGDLLCVLHKSVPRDQQGVTP